MTLPEESLRWPVSMTCDTSAFTSTRSPFLASFLSSLIRGFTVVMRILLADRADERTSAAAAADCDLHLLHGHVAGAVVHLCEGRDVLRLRQADARVRFGGAARRREPERHHAAARIAVSHHQHVAAVGLLGHRAVYGHRHRYGVAVLGDLRQIELHAALRRLPAAGEFRDQVLRVVGGLRGRNPCARHERQATEPDPEHLAAIADAYHD